MRVHQPSPAERARTVLRLAPYLRVRVPGERAEVDLHGVDPDGSVVLVLPDDSPVVAAARRSPEPVPALVDAADVCPVPMADRVRGRVRLVGWVHEPPAHLRRELALVAADRDGAGALLDIGSGRTVLYLQVAEVQYVDGGADPDDVAAVVAVDREDYAAAMPDPLAGGRGRAAAPPDPGPPGRAGPAGRAAAAGGVAGRRRPGHARSGWTGTGCCCGPAGRTCGWRSPSR